MLGCSSFTLTAKDQTHLLARTMDFDMQMAQAVIYTPAGDTMLSSYDTATFTSRFATLGMGIRDDNGTVLYDGVNEKGLTGATLYFPGYAAYHDQAQAGRLPVTPDKLTQYVLSQYDSVASLQEGHSHDVTLVDEPNPILKITAPLHYIYLDREGHSLVVEPTKNGLKFYRDSIGVMTNSPDYPWMLTNLRNYLPVNPEQRPTANWLGQELKPFSQGSGTFGLPGDYTPPSRFVKTTFMKQFTVQPDDEISAVSTAAAILKTVSIPNGGVREGKLYDHTCYTAFMSATSRRFYFGLDSNQRLQEVALTPELLSEKQVKVFPVDLKEDIKTLN